MSVHVKGAKAGQQQPRQPVISPDSAASKTYLKILYGLSEGEIEGLANGLQSIYLDDTPLYDANNNINIPNVKADFRAGTNDQTYIDGFPDVSNEISVNVELQSVAPYVRAFTNPDLDAVRVRLKWGALRTQNMENGDVTGVMIEYAIDVKTGTGAYQEVIRTKVQDKTSEGYERSHRVDLPTSTSGWQVRVRRITPNANVDNISDKMYIAAVTEIIDAKLRYPNTALLGLQYDAETFSSVAKMSVRCKGVRFQVPTNYNAETRTYSGMWNGTFKRAYTNNPAWIYYGLCTEKRYGLGDRLSSSMIDKWSLYRLAQYCDQLVDDGKGGLEPRFTCNVYLQSKEDAYDILQKLAGVFRAISFWDGDSIVCDMDAPQDTFFTYTRANVLEGQFEYSGTRTRDRHTVAKVAWDNPDNRYKTEYEFIRDEKAISELGYRVVEIDAWGCTSQGQAQRAGLWALKSEQLETRNVKFKVGLDGHIPQPGKIIEIADELFAGRANGGRVAAISVNRKVITIDRDDVVAAAGDRLVINGEDGKAVARVISSISGREITLVAAFPENSIAVQNVWVVDAAELATMRFRVMSITQEEHNTFSIEAIQHEPQKYAAIDDGAYVEPRPISMLKPTLQDPPTDIVISSRNRVAQGINITTMVISWTQPIGAVKYLVEWRKDDGAWIKLPIATSNSIDIDGIYAGNYQAKVTAINAFDVASMPAFSVLTTLTGKIGNPPALAGIHATGILFGMRVDWSFPAGADDSAYTEIEVADDNTGLNGRLQGLFSYPTNTTLIQGLQGNLTLWFRGRLVDRIGNVGAWSNWTSGTTSADALAILELLDEQISSTQLDQDLRTSIDKIQGIEDALDGIDLADLTNITEKVDGIYQITTPNMIGSTADLIGSNEVFAGTWTIQSAYTDNDNALSQRIDTVQSNFNANLATVQTEVNAVSAAQSATASSVSTLQTTVSGHTSSIQVQQQSINGLYAQYTVKLDTGGRVSGFGLASSNTSSEFIIRADRFSIAPAVSDNAGNAGKRGFVYQSSSKTLANGTVVPAGLYLNTAIVGYISANKIDAQDLSAVTAKIGVLRTATSGARVEIRDNLIIVYDANNRVRVRLGIW